MLTFIFYVYIYGVTCLILYMHTHIQYSLHIQYFIHIIVNGGWSEWTYGPCSKTCNNGVRTKNRICNNPPPSCGGEQCSGVANVKEVCLVKHCESKFQAFLLCLCFKSLYNYVHRL